MKLFGCSFPNSDVPDLQPAAGSPISHAVFHVAVMAGGAHDGGTEDW